ncbi:methylated-DNA--[protein]-cysteine S-methyltransferase [Enterococcus sp. CWB-B31]|uniref:methylated-DNA--[protein]-cysteine S-methyltransferase n=1 Tax=Enterococcus sp. CWB-B31 TaxID=2885159 RepID=UPI001E3239CF|nr:methylated-DNA--[protein]-cysteine S-methyltransferase [Enterococcus sp. CWB-B31]MCB5955175.1 methylated-DNA--[protein]-cysteine S-methyltransferase [Enterococcus sp. CWB-B31]
MKIITPIGPIWLNANEQGLTEVSFFQIADHQTNCWTEQAALELDTYFSGKLKEFTTPLLFEKGTVFQKKVWDALLSIPYGETRSYLDIAKAVNSEKAVRAIGQANRNNPFPIIVPCHRVIGKNGKLTGYLGKTNDEGLSIKSYLLELENAL